MHLKYECATANSDITFYADALLGSLVTHDYNTGTNYLVGLFYSARLKRIELRGISSAVNKISTIAIQWTGLTDSMRELTASGNTESAFSVTTSPPSRSTSSFWKRPGNTDPLFRIITDGDFGEAQMDLYFDVTFTDNGAVGVNWTAPVGALFGTLYTTAADNTTNGTTWNATPRWIPVGRTTIA